jgi:hypothetical protein
LNDKPPRVALMSDAQRSGASNGENRGIECVYLSVAQVTDERVNPL